MTTKMKAITPVAASALEPVAISAVAQWVIAAVPDGETVTRDQLYREFGLKPDADHLFSNHMRALHHQLRTAHKRLLAPLKEGVWRLVPPNEHAEYVETVHRDAFTAVMRSEVACSAALDRGALNQAERQRADDIQNRTAARHAVFGRAMQGGITIAGSAVVEDKV